MTAPLLPIATDPSIVAGRQTKADFVIHTQAVRSDFSLSDIAKAQEITKIWESTNTRLTQLYADLQKRRRARLDVLDTVVPVGPSIPANASPADTAVLQQAFRSALAEARQALASTDPNQAGIRSSTISAIAIAQGSLEAMLADAERFDDDNLRRAVLTAALEAGRLDLVTAWTDQHGVTDQLMELNDIRRAIAGEGFDQLTVVQALGVIAQPDEVGELPRLLAARDAATTQAGITASQATALRRF